eukprot:751545-Hanusia_phi.AAC.1
MIPKCWAEQIATLPCKKHQTRYRENHVTFSNGENATPVQQGNPRLTGSRRSVFIADKSGKVLDFSLLLLLLLLLFVFLPRPLGHPPMPAMLAGDLEVVYIKEIAEADPPQNCKYGNEEASNASRCCQTTLRLARTRFLLRSTAKSSDFTLSR